MVEIGLALGTNAFDPLRNGKIAGVSRGADRAVVLCCGGVPGETSATLGPVADLLDTKDETSYLQRQTGDAGRCLPWQNHDILGA